MTARAVLSWDGVPLPVEDRRRFLRSATHARACGPGRHAIIGSLNAILAIHGAKDDAPGTDENQLGAISVLVCFAQDRDAQLDLDYSGPQALSPLLVYGASNAPIPLLRAWSARASVTVCADESVSLEKVLSELAQSFGVEHVVVEVGCALYPSLFEKGFVDELLLVTVPKIMGMGACTMASGLSGLPGTYLPASVRARLLKIEQLDEECVTLWKLSYAREFSEKVDSPCFEA